MTDQASFAQALGASGGVSNEPPTRQPSDDNAPHSAATPVDDGSDFYNTPLVAGTPVNASGNAQSSTNNSEPTTPPKSAPLIPGLSLFNESLAASQQTNGSLDLAEKINEHKETEQDSAVAAEAMQVDVEKGDSEMHDAPTGAGNATAAEQSTKQDGAMPEQPNHSLDASAAHTGDGMLTRESETQEATLQDLAAEEGEHPEWEIDSSPYESSSDDSSTDSSDDDSEEDDEDYPILSPEEQARILMMAEAGSDDEEGKGKPGAAYVRTTNEQPEEVPPIPDVTVTPEMKIELLGTVQAIVGNTVLIKANTSGEYQVLESGSLLCLEDHSVVGVVSETLGRVQEPLYTVRFETADAVSERGVEKERTIYYVPEHSTFVFTQPLKGMKGSDASNFHDEEVGEEEMEFSDDEAEAEYRRKLKQKRQEKKQARDGGVPGRAKKELPGPSKLGQMELNYDDVSGGDGYTPLARPANLHEMMTTQEAPVEKSQHSGRGGRGGRGRGGFDRGSGRGRGGRNGGNASWDSRRSHGSQDDRRQSRDSRQGSSAGKESEQNPYMPPPPFPQAQQQQYQRQQQQQQAYYNAQQFPAYPAYPQTQQAYSQFPTAPQFTFQAPYQQPFQQAYQPNPYQQMPAGSHISPALIAALQQHQQMQQQQQQQQQHQQQAGYPQAQNAAAALSQVQAQLDLLRQLSGGGAQGPPRS